MKIRYYDDGKEKFMSHELHLEFEYNEMTVMSDSKANAIEDMKKAIDKLIESLKSIDWQTLTKL